jgi:cell division transport system ATP-binding protein
VIRFDNVSKSYPKQNRPALRDVSLEVEKGEFVFLVGSSGSGKSTFLRLLLREERASQGQVHVLGKDLARLSNWKVPQMRRQLGTVFQDFRLLPNKTVAENVAFAQEVIGKPKGEIRKAVPQVLDLVGLGGKEDRMPGELSGGEQQRVAIARAFVNRPMLLIADEPTGNLDLETSWQMMDLFGDIAAFGTAVLIATHNVEIVTRLQRRVMTLVQGRLVRDQPAGRTGRMAWLASS